MLNHSRSSCFARNRAADGEPCLTKGLSFAPFCLGGPRLAGLLWWGLLWWGLLWRGPGLAWGQEGSPDPAADAPPPAAASTVTLEQESKPEGTGEDAGAKKEPPFQIPKSWRRVTKDHEVWIDFSQKRVIVGGHICLREGMLEMFACPKGTTEHESIVSVHSEARYVHAALVAVGRWGPTGAIVASASSHYENVAFLGFSRALLVLEKFEQRGCGFLQIPVILSFGVEIFPKFG